MRENCGGRWGQRELWNIAGSFTFSFKLNAKTHFSLHHDFSFSLTKQWINRGKKTFKFIRSGLDCPNQTVENETKNEQIPF